MVFVNMVVNGRPSLILNTRHAEFALLGVGRTKLCIHMEVTLLFEYYQSNSDHLENCM